jgi:aspartokinase-like uncharacterized kinase
MIVVKVGGSLFTLPDLIPKLRAWLQRHTDEIWLVPGGGKLADAIRELDATHHLGDEHSHDLAMRTLSISADFLRCQVGDLCRVIDCDVEFRNDPTLQKSWDITSDTLALHIALRHSAACLVLLKSCDPADAVAAGRSGTKPWIDPGFAQLAQSFRGSIHVVNFRNVPPLMD